MKKLEYKNCDIKNKKSKFNPFQYNFPFLALENIRKQGVAEMRTLA